MEKMPMVWHLVHVVLVVALHGVLSQQHDQGHHQEFDEPNRSSSSRWNFNGHFALDAESHEELAKNYFFDNVLIRDFDMNDELMAQRFLNYDLMTKNDSILDFPKAISNEDMKLNGSCIFWVNCAEETVKENSSGNAMFLQHGLCCEQGRWIGTTSDDMGLEPFNGQWRIGAFMVMFSLLSSLSVLVALRSSMTRFAIALEPHLRLATSLFMSWLSSYPLTSLVIGIFIVFLLYIGYNKRNRQVKLKSRSHLGPCRRRRWKGNLQERWQSHLRLRGLVFMMLYLEVGGMDAQQATDMLTRIMDLSQAATQAATTASNLMNEFQSSQGKGGSRFGDGAKILRTPDVFDVDDPVKYTLWREQFINWITFCDPKYGELIRDVEALDIVEPIGTLEPNIRELGIKLYSILSSYLRGPALQVVRSCSNDRNGFAVWHKLKSLYAPRARPRALAIGQAIMQHPSFGGQKSMLENLLQFDSLLDQYEMASGQKMPDDLTVSTILRCIDAPTRRHLEMVMDETYTYGKLKEKLILLDKNTKSWSGDSFLKSLQTIQNPATSSSTTSQGPVPMEVDQVSYGYKGKGKNKGKSGKGKKGGWFGIPYGKSYGKGKSKSKHKGKKGKSKNKGKQSSKGKGYGNGNNSTCRLCGQQGHWGNECPNRNNVSQVNDQSGAAQGQSGDAASVGGTTSTRRTSVGSASTTSQSTTSRASNVRRVKLYSIATPPISGPEIYELESNEDGEEWYSTCMVRSVDYEVFNMAVGDEAEGEEWKSDPLYGWYGNISHDFDKVKISADDDVDWYHVRAVPLQDAQLIVLDSGADISLLPKSMCEKGTSRRLGKTVLQDAQGSRLETFGKRSAQLECESCSEDLVVIEDDFIVASVQAPLISLGRLLHKGWSLQPSSEAEAGVCLITPDRCCQVPLCFKKNSLALHAHVRMVNMVEENFPTSLPLTSIEEHDEPILDENEDEEMMVIQTIMEPSQELLARIFRRGWAHTEAGNPFIVMPASTTFLDPSLLFPVSSWPRRSTLVQLGDFRWEVIEHCVLYSTKENISGEIEECKGNPTMVMTILHSKEEALDNFGEVASEDVVSAGGRTLDSSSFTFSAEPSVPPELQEGMKPEELEQLDQGRGLFKELEKFEWTFENKDTLMVGSTMIKKDSSIALMRAGAEYLGISKSGSKETPWTRLNQSVQKFEHQRLFQDANKLYREEMEFKGMKPQAQPRSPSDQERMLHEHTHLPFRSWCDFCVSCKSKMDAQRPVDDVPEGRREGPSMQIDYCYGKIAPGDPAVTVLVGLDCQTKMLTAMPVETKGSNLRGQAEHITRFSLMMNHLDKLELVADSEPTYVKSLPERFFDEATPWLRDGCVTWTPRRQRTHSSN